MRFIKFTIKNYKGIENCTINVDTAKPRVFPLVGLNESGKTTLLEAINLSVSKDEDVENIAETAGYQKDKISFIPKSKKISFSESVQIKATSALSEEDFKCFQDIAQQSGYEIKEIENLQNFNLNTEVKFSYENSICVNSQRSCDIVFYAKKIKKRGKNSFEPINNKHDLWDTYVTFIKNHLPSICYFPTFAFTVPEKIYLTTVEGEESSNFYYRQLIQEILFSIDPSFTIQKNILEHFKVSEKTWSEFSQSSEFDIIKQTLQKLSQQISQAIIVSWKKIFPKTSQKISDKQIAVEIFYDETRKSIYLKLALRENYEEYSINERSLGFRWFFCFWLFTYFKVNGSKKNGNVFLLDEPASNLHANAQKQILKNIISLANDKNIIIYSTHSHYLLDPTLIEKTYVVRNKAISYDISIEDVNKSSIDAILYRQFVAKYPNQKSYFLPLLEVLDYVPSTFEFQKPSLLVEGKTDFFFLSLILSRVTKDYAIIPGTGATTLAPILSILRGWNQKSIVLLDSDKEGKKQKIKYISEFFDKEEDKVQTLDNFDSKFDGKSLEDIILEVYKDDINSHFNNEMKNNKSNKDLAQLYISECYQTILSNSDDSFEIKESLKPFIQKLEAWIKEYLL